MIAHDSRRAAGVSPSRCVAARRGVSLIELIATLALIGTVTATMIPLVTLSNAQRRAAAARQTALLKINSILETFTARKWDDITPETAKQLQLSDSTKQSLPDAKLTVIVVRADGDPSAKQVTVELRWNDHKGRPVSPARLTAFVYKPAEGK